MTRFDKHLPGRVLQQISIEELNEFVIKLRKSGLSANTVLHNVIIIAQFCRRNGRPNLTRELQLPAAIHFLPKVYSEEQQSRFLVWHAIPGSGLYFRRSCLRDSGNRK